MFLTCIAWIEWAFYVRVLRRLLCVVASVLLGLAPAWAAPETTTGAAGSNYRIVKPLLSPAEEQWLKEHPIIRVGADPKFAPYSVIGENGEFSGASADYLSIISKQLGVHFEIVEHRRWADILDAAKSRDIDLIATAVRTPARDAYLVFSEPYLATPLVIMTRSDDTSLRSAADLDGRTVALVQGYSSTVAVLAGHPQVRPMTVRAPLEGLIAVATGQADAYVGAIGVNLAVASANGISNLRIAAPFDLNNGQRFGVRNDWGPLVGILSKALAAIPEAEKYRINLRWVPGQIPNIVSGKPALREHEKRWLQQHPRVRFGFIESLEPIEYLAASGQPAGLVAGYLDLLSQKTGLSFETVPTKNQDEQLAMLAAGQLDMASVHLSGRRRGLKAALSQPFENSALAIFTLKDAPLLGGVGSLAGKKVAMSGAWATPVLLRHQSITADLKATPLLALASVNEGASDAAILDFAVGRYLQDKYFPGKLNLVHVLAGEETSLYFAVRPDWPELLEIVNQSLMAASQEDFSLIRRHALSDTRLRGVNPATVALWSAVASLVVVSAFFVFRYRAKLAVLKEVRRRRAADKAARASERRFAVTFEQAEVGIAMVAPNGAWLRVNPHLCEMLGYSEADLLRINFQEVTYPDDLDADVKQVKSVLDGEIDTYSMDKRYVHKDGQIVWGQLTVSLVRDDDGQPAYFIAVVKDVTQRKHDEARIDFLAFHDALTGLPNRVLIADRVVQAISDIQRSDMRLALLFLDLDHFKEVNDTLGHRVGDQLLKQVSERLKACLRAGDTLGRQGGDEFIVLMSHIAAVEPVRAVMAAADKLFEQLRPPFYIEGHELSVSGSIGIAIYPDEGSDFDTLLRKADTAMYAAKSSGRNAYHFFTEEMNRSAVEYEQLRNGIRFALERGQLSLHYQPQINFETRQVVGVEALLRWNHPQLGSVSPARFIPVAEDCGMIIPIGAWVIQEACRQAVAWQGLAHRGLKMAVNLSPVQFRRNELVETVTQALKQSGLEASKLELELTESILVHDTEHVLDTLRKLQALGVRLAIDDFGTGYSSLAYLKRFPLQQLKIDQTFVRDMIGNPDAEAIVLSIIGLANNLRLATIAEGIETQEQLDMLVRLGCPEGQGYLLGRPMPAEQLAGFLAQHNR